MWGLMTVFTACVAVGCAAGPPTLWFSVCPGDVESRDTADVSHVTESFQTVHTAAIALKAARLGGHSGDITVSLCEGQHPHRAPLVITPEHTSDVGRTSFVGAGRGASLNAGEILKGIIWQQTAPVLGTPLVPVHAYCNMTVVCAQSTSCT
jgi:hypothetical protein